MNTVLLVTGPPEDIPILSTSGFQIPIHLLCKEIDTQVGIFNFIDWLIFFIQC